MERLIRDLRAFAQERDWGQFHTPRNLAAALSVEAAEVLEHFQWLSDEESKSLPSDVRRELAEEIGDVVIYVAMLADKLGIDPLEAARRKLEKNRQRYPVEKARGSAKKYTEL